MKFLFAIVAISACVLATNLVAARQYNNEYNSNNNNDGPVNAAPVGTLESVRILPSGKPAVGAPVLSYRGAQVYGPSAVEIRPASQYGPGYGQDAQVQSLIKIALALPTPQPNLQNNGRGVGTYVQAAPAY